MADDNTGRSIQSGESVRVEQIVAQTLKRLYPQNPDIVFGREARTIVAAIRDAGLVVLEDSGDFAVVERPLVVDFIRVADLRPFEGDFNAYHAARHDLVMALGGDL